MPHGDQKGVLLQVWLGPDDRWMFDEIDAIQKQFESKGIRISRAEIARRAMKIELEKTRAKREADDSSH